MAEDVQGRRTSGKLLLLPRRPRLGLREHLEMPRAGSAAPGPPDGQSLCLLVVADLDCRRVVA